MAEDVNPLESVWRNPKLRPLVAGRLLRPSPNGCGTRSPRCTRSRSPGWAPSARSVSRRFFPRRFCRPRWATSSTGTHVNACSPRCSRCASSRWIVAAVSAAFFPSVGVLVAVAVAEGVASVFVRPTTAALLPSVTRRPEDLVRAHAALGFADNIGVLVGPVCGGLILAGTTPAHRIRDRRGTGVLLLRRDGQSGGGRPRSRPADPHSRSTARIRRIHQGRGDRRRTRRALGCAGDRAGLRLSGASEVFVVPLAIEELGSGRGRNRRADGVHCRRRLIAGVVLGMIGKRRLGPWFSARV